MQSVGINIIDKFELLALHRCLLEAKFSPDPEDGDIAGSPIAAKLANSVMSELEAFDEQGWSEWRKAENHPERIEALISSLSKQHHSSLVGSVEKRNHVIDALAPLLASEAIINDIISKVYGTS